MKVEKIDKTGKYVYDISCDGTFVNALGRNVLHNTDGMNYKQPDVFRYTKDNPYISTGLNRNTQKGKEYIGPWGDLAEFNDLYMRVKNGLDIDEFVPSSCYLARKNYMDLLDVESQKVKLVGNSIKSKKLQVYIEKFIDDVVRDLLNDRGYEYLEKYYDKIEQIYNYKIPLKDIASVGKIKISLDEYKKECKKRTKSGSKKARQAWYELAIKHNLDVHMGDAIYYINTGSKKSDPDVKRETHYYTIDPDGEKIDKTKEYHKEYNKLKKLYKEGDREAEEKLFDIETNKVLNVEGYIKKYYPNSIEEDVLTFNCVLVPREIIEDEDDHYCDEEIGYNVEKYINIFNNRIKCHLVCFDKSIRLRTETDKKGNIKQVSNILITNPKDRKYFTREEAKLVSGQPNNPTDQDTYEQLMTMDDKEIAFWIKVGKTPVYVNDCGMNWEEIVQDYKERMQKLEQKEIKEEVAEYNRLINKITNEEVQTLIDDGYIPESILKMCDYNKQDNSFISKKYKIKIGDIFDILNKQIDEIEEMANDKEFE